MRLKQRLTVNRQMSRKQINIKPKKPLYDEDEDEDTDETMENEDDSEDDEE